MSIEEKPLRLKTSTEDVVPEVLTPTSGSLDTVVVIFRGYE